ncbi:MAG: hypothetical protein OXR73_32165 [Myxococcales bacterium]|nr:hypothetical protein [Myxococcales bacterium]
MQKLLAKALVLGAFVASLSGYATEAHAESFKLRLDNYLNPSGYGHAATPASVIVTVYFNNGGLALKSRVLDTVSGSHDFTFNPSNNGANTINYIEIALNSTPPMANNLFILDQLELFNSSGQKIRTWGLDNEYGYCISWQASDGSNSHCHDGKAYWGRSFFP